MKRLVVLLLFFMIALGAVIVGFRYNRTVTGQARENINVSERNVAVNSEPTVSINTPPKQYTIPSQSHVSQTFNNCGPATLSMIMAYSGQSVSQDTLREKMRPFNNPSGGVDDKSIFADEFVKHAKEYGLASLNRPNGTIDLLKAFIANDIPVVVRTWLHPNEDIGHFRVVRGYDENKKVIIQDDSYEGKNLTYSYDTFLSMWEPFNYGYILIYPKEKQAVVDAILGEERDERIAWQNALSRSEKELKERSLVYASFNQATAYYHLGDYEKAIESYEQAKPSLPPRMLWYQIEPIQAYLKIENFEEALQLTNNILTNGNKAFSEVYYIRGEIFQKQGNYTLAKQEFEQAIFYNKFFEPAKTALSQLQP